MTSQIKLHKKNGIRTNFATLDEYLKVSINEFLILEQKIENNLKPQQQMETNCD